MSVLVSAGPGTAALPAVEGLTTASAESKLRSAGFKPSTQEQSSGKVAQGHVISTDPSAGIVVQVGSPVTVFVSSGPAQIHVPELVGQSQKGAEAALSSAGLALGAITPQVSASQTPGTVLSQSPAAAASLPAGGKVNLVVAQAPKEVAVPSVVGQSEAQASAALGGAGFTPRTTTVTTTEPAQVGMVLKQSPAGGHQAPKGSTVTISIGVAAQTTPTTPTTHPDDADEHHANHHHLRGHANPDPRPVSAKTPLRVAVLAGGRSAEHEVSLSSGRAVEEGLKAAGHEVLWVQIERDGAWRHVGRSLSVCPGEGLLGADVVFPALHGPFGEDGTVQGLLETLDVAYVGAGVTASAVCMDKVLFKQLMSVAGVAQVEYVGVRETRWRAARAQVLAELAGLGLPVFVKPAHLGSSVGIVKVAVRGRSWRMRWRGRSHTRRW